MDDTAHYKAFMRQLAILRDRVRGVVAKEATGFYLHGRAGTSKTHTIFTTLDQLGANYMPANGHLTPIGLFNSLDENRDRILVIDDVATLFNQPLSLQFLLAALGSPNGRSQIRKIRHKTAAGERVIPYTGGIIAISNLSLSGHHNEILEALRDRIFVTGFEPTDEQVCALIHHLAGQGIKDVAPQDARVVADFVIGECKARGVRPSVRLFIDKALADFRLYRAGKTECDWRDLVINSIEQQMLELEHPTRGLDRAGQIEAERQIALQIVLEFKTQDERLAAWKKRTGKSQAALYRRMADLKRKGLL
jgi:hypothetical protein